MDVGSDGCSVHSYARVRLVRRRNRFVCSGIILVTTRDDSPMDIMLCASDEARISWPPG